MGSIITTSGDLSSVCGPRHMAKGAIQIIRDTLGGGGYGKGG